MIRLYVNEPLTQDTLLTRTADDYHYLIKVMRLKEGDKVQLFNGPSGQWQCQITHVDKKAVTLTVCTQVHPPHAPKQHIHAVLAPIKLKRLEMAVEKLTELGVTDIHLVITQYTQVRQVNEDRLLLIAKEAAEQCERLDLPTIHSPVPLTHWIEHQASQPTAQVLLMADEREGEKQLLEALETMPPAEHIGFIIGPEGGFAPDERQALSQLSPVIRVSLGPLILRAETAALVMAAQVGLRAHLSA